MKLHSVTSVALIFYISLSEGCAPANFNNFTNSSGTSFSFLLIPYHVFSLIGSKK